MKDVINIDDLKLDNSETLESKGFGKMSLGKLLKDNEVTTQSAGYNALLEGKPVPGSKPKFRNTKKIETITTEIQNFDPMVINEILRTVREKNHFVEDKLNQLSQLPQKLTILEDQIFDIKKLATNNINKDIESKTEDKRKVLYIASVLLICIGFILGSMINQQQVDPSKSLGVNSDQSVIKPKALVANSQDKKLLITKKFINLRSKNSPKSKVLLTVAPSQIVEVLERKGGWVRVNYHNRLTGKKTNGYLWDEFLTNVK